MPIVIRYGGPSSGLGRAFAVSLLLHLVLLWPGAPALPNRDRGAPLTAVLRPSAEPHVPLTPTMVPEPASSARPEQARKPGPSSDFAVSAAEPRVVTTNDSTTASPIRSAADAGIPSALSPSEGIDAEGLRSYRLALAREARRYKRYPAQAIDAGRSGTAELRVSVRAGGIAQEVQLAKSSGHTELDDAALEMLRQALPATPVPAVLREREFALSLPVVFELPE